MTVHDAPAPSLRHLARLSDQFGVVEHALLDRPRRDEGYCTDDAGRLLALACQVADDPDAKSLARSALAFLERAHLGGAQFRLRMRGDLSWTSDPASDDAVGRALLGLGTAVAAAPWEDIRDRSFVLFEEAASFRSPFLHATAYAALGAVEVLNRHDDHVGASQLLERTSTPGGRATDDEIWPWPETRLRYDNAVIPEASLARANSAGDEELKAGALRQLRWLIELQTREAHLSFVPVGGVDVTSPLTPQFDQQPIEAWSCARGAARAFALTGERYWYDTVQRAVAWFLGDNDIGAMMFDEETGGGYDGLEPGGVNRNQGAESSMAFVATMLAWREVGSVPTRDVRDVLAAY